MPRREDDPLEGTGMFEGLFQPMHLLMFFFLIFCIPLFLVCRWLWRQGSKD
jgi:hypothetical protein